MICLHCLPVLKRCLPTVAGCKKKLISLASIALPLPDIKYEWLIELKYLKEGERSNLEQAKQKRLAQLQKYVASKNLTSKQDLKKALVIFIGKKDYVLVNETGQMI